MKQNYTAWLMVPKRGFPLPDQHGENQSSTWMHRVTAGSVLHTDGEGPPLSLGSIELLTYRNEAQREKKYMVYIDWATQM